MKSIGLLFGSFNPLHNGHSKLAQTAQSEAGLDEVWFVVQPENPYKPGITLLDTATRKRLIAQSGLTTYSPKTIDYQHYVLDTLKELGDYNLTLLLGEDLADSFNQWPDYEVIRTLATMYTSKRHDDISSAMVRERLGNNQPIDDLVPKPVAQYLQQTGR
jgi:nicotinate-nucleotide adenylyltransferase